MRRVFLALSVLIPAASTAQEVPRPEIKLVQPRPSIVAFNSIKWGSSRDEVVKEYGEPMYETAREPDVAVLGYTETILGQETIVYFYVHRTEGLLRGEYAVKYGMGEDCLRVYQLFRDAIAKSYSQFTPEEDRSNSSSLGFCGGVAIGQAYAYALWRDPVDTTGILLTIQPEDDFVRVTYEPPAGSAWIRKADAAERRKRF